MAILCFSMEHREFCDSPALCAGSLYTSAGQSRGAKLALLGPQTEPSGVLLPDRYKKRQNSLTTVLSFLMEHRGFEPLAS